MSSIYSSQPSIMNGAPQLMSSRVLASIPCYKGTGNSNDETCSLCFEEMSPQSIFRQLPCKHLFHQPCIDKWMCERDASCPLCRQTFYDLHSAASMVTAMVTSNSNSDNETHVSRASLLQRWKKLFHLSSIPPKGQARLNV